MKKFILYVFVILTIPFTVVSQTGNVQNASAAKDAPVEVIMTDFKNRPLNHEIVVFKSKANTNEYNAVTDEQGKFSTRLPAGDSYEIFIYGFKDSSSYNILEIPALKGNSSYKDPFVVEIQHQPSKSFVLDDCNFETGKAELEEDSYPVLDELAAYLIRKDDVKIEIGGHTDNVGSATSNLKLSQDRATTVMTYLVAKGIDATRLTAKGYGMTKPVESNKTVEGRATNRRTEVTVLE